jgi:hypothetical protein
MTPWAKPEGFGGGGFQDNAWLGNAKRQSLFRAAAPNVPWATSKPAATPSLTQPAASNQQVGQRVQQPPASLFGSPAPSEPRDLWGRTAREARAALVDDYRGQLDIDRVRAAQGLQPLSWGHNSSSRAGLEAMLRSADTAFTGRY